MKIEVEQYRFSYRYFLTRDGWPRTWLILERPRLFHATSSLDLRTVYEVEFCDQ